MVLERMIFAMLETVYIHRLNLKVLLVPQSRHVPPR